VPTEFGGDGLDLRSLCIVREALAAGSGFVDAVFAVPGLGSYPIGLSGNQVMAERYLPSVASGASIAAFALTEPEAGSDASALATTARREGDGYVLDGAKIFISNATIAEGFERLADIHAGIVEQDVDRPELARRLAGEGPAGRDIGDVDRAVQGTPAERADLAGRLVSLGAVVEMAKGDIRALGGEGERRGAADPARAAGDQGGFTRELHAARAFTT
jgi:hypothetical protein